MVKLGPDAWDSTMEVIDVDGVGTGTVASEDEVMKSLREQSHLQLPTELSCLLGHVL